MKDTFFEFALIGSTASGKSKIAHELALKHDLVILSLDSLCLYKEINIASAKPSKKELSEVRYFGIDLISIEQSFNVWLFFKEYERARSYARTHNKALLIAGGSSFYLRALMQGLSEHIKEVPCELSNKELYELVKSIDKKARIEKNDTYRLKKWYSIYKSKAEIPSEFLQKTLKEAPIRQLEIFLLDLDKEELLKNIALRTKKMLENGLLQEARELFLRYDENLKPLKSIGLKECKSFLDNEISKEQLESLINIHTAQLAKRQRTFNKKFTSTRLDKNAFESLDEYIEKRLKRKAF